MSPSICEEDRIAGMTERLIEDYYFGERSFYAEVSRRMDRTARDALDKVLTFGADCLAGIRQTDEIRGLLNALDGKYADVPCRRTQILRNLVHLFLSCALIK